MTLVVTPALDLALQMLGDFITSVLSADAPVPVIALPTNRTPPPPPVPGFVGMFVARQSRIMTNVDTWRSPDPTTREIAQAIRLTVQLDCYSPSSAAWATILSGVFWDEVSVKPLAPILAPLYTADPIRAPLANGEEEYEDRWIVQTYLQYNPTVSVLQQFANRATVGLINVDVSYPP